MKKIFLVIFTSLFIIILLYLIYINNLFYKKESNSIENKLCKNNNYIFDNNINWIKVLDDFYKLQKCKSLFTVYYKLYPLRLADSSTNYFNYNWDFIRRCWWYMTKQDYKKQYFFWKCFLYDFYEKCEIVTEKCFIKK